MDEEGVEVNYIAGTPYVGMNVRMVAGPGGNRGAFTAWDVVAVKPVWIQRKLSRVERRRRNRRGRRFLRNHGGLVQGGECQDWVPALGIQDFFRDHWPTDRIQGPRRA